MRSNLADQLDNRVFFKLNMTFGRGLDILHTTSSMFGNFLVPA
jgi:hypothetical protein